jgi:hypothetical protein
MLAGACDCCTLETLELVEYFHDDVSVERTIFDGPLEPDGRLLGPSRSRSGLGLELRRDDAVRYLVHDSEARASTI